jgi:GT2 family glycosyltransferase
MNDTRLTVIIAAYNARATIGDCLESLRRQTLPGCFEVILVESSGDGTADYVNQQFPKVQVLGFDQRKFCGDARNIGISRARADVVAFIDADCRAEPTWVEEILKAHETPRLAIGGAIANVSRNNLVAWAAYFTEFSEWLPAGGSRVITDIAGANMSYKKKVFDRFGEFIEGTYCSDTEFHWRLAQHGVHLEFEPAILIAHDSVKTLGKFLGHELYHGRSFARVRTRAQHFPAVKRWLYAVAFPLIAVKKFLEICGNVLGKRVYLRSFMASLPLLVLGIAAWCAGEAIGYLETSGQDSAR